MQKASSLPAYLPPATAESIRQIYADVVILPLSCLFWWMDRAEPIQQGRILSDDLIYIPVKGSLRCHVGDTAAVIGPGELMFAGAGHSHGARLARRTRRLEAYAVHVHAFDPSNRSVFGRLASPFGRFGVPEAWFDRLALCTHLMGACPETGRRVLEALVRDLLAEQVRLGSALLETPVPLDHRIAGLLARIRQDCGQDWRVTRLARLCGLSAERLRQLFKASVGMPPKRYVQQVRLQQARAMLSTQPSLTVGEVARQVGFGDPHYFHAAYRDAFGETPKGRGGKAASVP